MANPRINFDEAAEHDAPDPLDGLDSEEEAAPQSVGAAVVETMYQNPDPQVTEDESDEINMNDVDERLEVAQCYRLLLKESMFNASSPATKKVDKRIRTFIRNELAVLMGVVQPVQQVKVESPFDETEVAVLKQIVAKAREMAQKASQQAPALNKVATKEQPKPQPVAVRKADVPKPAQPVVKKPTPAPQAPTPATQPPKTNSKLGAMEARVPERYRNDPTLAIKNGKVYVQAQTEDGSPLWVYDPIQKKQTPMMKDVTLPARPLGAHQPIPTPGDRAMYEAQYNQISQSQADSMMSLAEKSASRSKSGLLLAGAVVQSIIKNNEATEE